MSCLVNPRSGHEVDFPVPRRRSRNPRIAAGTANAPGGAAAVCGDRGRARGDGGGAGTRDARRRGPPLRGAGGAGRPVPLGAPGPRQGGLRGDDLLLRVRAPAPRRPPSPRPRSLARTTPTSSPIASASSSPPASTPGPSTSPAPTLPHVVDYAERLRVGPRRRAVRGDRRRRRHRRRPRPPAHARTEPTSPTSYERYEVAPPLWRVTRRIGTSFSPQRNALTNGTQL